MTTLEQLTSGVEIMLPENGLANKLLQAQKDNRQLVIKLGFDPTAPDLHLGHAVVLRKLRQFQDAGHRIVIIVGSFTAQIGDPTGKNKSRKPLSKEEVMANAETYIKQLAKVVDPTKCEVRFNDEWLSSLGFNTILELLSKVTVAQLLQRNDFNKRFTANMPIALHELMYPILQGFDSLQIAADIEMGGTDQLFNCTMGRQLQEAHGIAPQVVMCMPLLKGLDGNEKMSKSLNNIIALTDEPSVMFGKTMSIPDQLLPEFIELATSFSPAEKAQLLQQLAAGENPMNIKKKVAVNIVNQYHGEERAITAEVFFTNQFQRKKFEEMEFKPISKQSLFTNATEVELLELCWALKKGNSKSDLRRLITGGGVHIDNEKIIDPKRFIRLAVGLKIKLGRLTFIELTE
jgi:tyrosyl-tRNA synthetase